MPVSAERLGEMQLVCRRAMAPIDGDRLKGWLKRLLDGLNPPKDQNTASRLAEWWGRNESLYVAALSDLPEDLVSSACMEVVKSSKFFPKPADIRCRVEEDWRERVAMSKRLETMRIVLAKTPPKPSRPAKRTPEELAKAEEIMARWRARSHQEPSAGGA